MLGSKYNFMRSYSLTLIVSPDLKDSERKKLLDSVSGYLKESSNLKANEWGQKPLTFPIKRQVAGYYIDYTFETDSLPLDLEKRLITADGVLRHLLLKTKTPKAQKKEATASSSVVEKKSTKSSAKEEKKVVKKTTVKRVTRKVQK